ncbi:MAG: Ldh family oxidoreductase [Synergistaceae bacterium]|jgi:LDH2 family malate/lactate/ureidoglycolate dehydrogenase|nr:Ldh family oxidoreductase [Synergistaceae bacterium]
MAYVSIPWEQAERFVVDAFKGYGVPEADAEVCADVLLEADRRGIESHGLNRLKPVYLDRIKAKILNPVTEVEVVKDGPTTAVVDGHDGMGQVIGKRSMRIAIDKAKKLGMGMVAARNSSHYGIAGYYTSMASAEGCVGISGTNARPSIAPTFGVENMLGTNPLTFGIPTDEPFNFSLDCATSIIQRGKVETLARNGMPVPVGTVIGEDGSALSDAGAILTDMVKGTAALAPLGGIGEELAGYKGFGYATVVEIMSAAFQNGKFLKQLNDPVGPDGKRQPYHLGHFFIAIDVGAFLPESSFRKTAGDILRELRASKKAPGHDRIYTAGEKEYLTRQERASTGVPVNDSVQRELIAVRDELGLKYRFPFE